MNFEKEGLGVGPKDAMMSFETVEHLLSSGFLVQNVQNSAGLLVILTPIGECSVPYHNQIWNLLRIKGLLRHHLNWECRYQSGQIFHWAHQARLQHIIGRSQSSP